MPPVRRNAGVLDQIRQLQCPLPVPANRQGCVKVRCVAAVARRFAFGDVAHLALPLDPLYLLGGAVRRQHVRVVRLLHSFLARGDGLSSEVREKQPELSRDVGRVLRPERALRGTKPASRWCLRVVELSAIPKPPPIKSSIGKKLLRKKNVSFPGLSRTMLPHHPRCEGRPGRCSRGRTAVGYHGFAVALCSGAAGSDGRELAAVGFYGRGFALAFWVASCKHPRSRSSFFWNNFFLRTLV